MLGFAPWVCVGGSLVLVPPGSHTLLKSLPQKPRVIHLPAPTLISQTPFNFSKQIEGVLPCPGFRICHLLAGELRPGPVSSLSFGFLTCKVGSCKKQWQK